ncbi:TetR/AcrR family transcriptional regulator [Pedobacter yulinensis]|uniref:TetR/AcrR family transcriptional regulator n=1 Tax=Pedobacter yulinensis TaxID=2126353 RepID=A0A2T3HJS6_9SPHI|nr:TetR/AcrR family transcriptional regulator [Pedobacter yulinensis]PST82694.1 TetR/AcrR family transcriptional regulator [Pedobacter yulinensis]
MDRKKSAGAPRNKALSKQKIMDAVEKILIEKSFTALKVNDIAAVAGLDKKLIYNYFGGTDQLLDEYIHSKDFWSNVKNDAVPAGITDGGKAFVQERLLSQFEYVANDQAFQKILLWRLSEQREALEKLTASQEAAGEALLENITDPHFGDRAEHFRAVMAILISSAYYLNLYASVNGSTFCGIDLSKAEGRESIRRALSFLVDSVYQKP